MPISTKFFRIFGCFFLFAIFFASCKPDNTSTSNIQAVKALKDYDATSVTQWQDLFLLVERYASGYRPCPSARMTGYLGIAVYEATVSGTTDYQSIAPRYAGLAIPKVETGKEYHWPTVINSVYATLFKKFFANVRTSDVFQIVSLESSLNAQYANQTSSDVFTRSKDYGKSVAQAVWDFSTTDTYGHDQYLNARPTSYVPPTGIGKWQPTPPGNERGLFPYWGKARVFAIQEADKVGRPPLTYSEDKISAYYAQGLEIYARTTPQSSEDRWIAEFWSDDVLGFTFSPPSRWLAITTQAINQDKSSLEKAVLAAVKVGLALNDASVACWNSKYLYNVERPVTYMQKYIDPNWNIGNLTSTGFLPSTPSFPAYPSGHSTFGSAAAEALTSVFGEDFALTDRCHQNRTDFNGTPRSFGSFYDMAIENAYSRIWLGVHWRMDCDEGVRLGYLAGRRVNALPFKK